MLSIFVFSVIVSVVCCLVVPRLLIRFDFLDIPSSRSSHSRPTPKGGGVGLVLVFVGVAWFAHVSILFWGPLAALACVSFINDLRSVRASRRLAVQGVCAGIVLVWANFAGLVDWPAWLLPLAVLFVVGTANCYNFMDGINGMAGISGLVAFGCIVWMFPEHVATSLSVAILGGIVGFLPFNLPRAKLFMGDVGSVFLGCAYALFCCLLATTWADFLLLTSFLFTFYADELVSVVVRVRTGTSLLLPHRLHLYQLLANERNIPHWKVSCIYGGAQLLCALFAVLLRPYGVPALISLQVLALIGCFYIYSRVRQGEHIAA